MPDPPRQDTHQKALTINLDAAIYGTLAEIGAGQEVARWFLQVGGASGTVASTISAYDMTVSDQLYGKVGRYVSRDRVAGMLDREYELLLRRLGPLKGGSTRFFVFADTVSARNFAGTNECHGWIGMRFQITPGGEPNDVILHVNLVDPTNLQQQLAVGILGVNLIYAAYYQRRPLETFLATLFDELSMERIEIDVIDFAGPEFADVDRRSALIQLVHRDCTEAVLLPGDGHPVPPSERIRKRPLLLEPVISPTVEPEHATMLKVARDHLEPADAAKLEPLSLFVLNSRLQDADATRVPAQELLARADQLLNFGIGVLIARQPELHRVVAYTLRYTSEPVRIVVAAITLADVFHARHYTQLDGQLMEGLARLFACNVRFYIYPTPASAAVHPNPSVVAWAGRPDANGLITLETLEFPRPISHLFEYLVDSGFLHSLPAG